MGIGKDLLDVPFGAMIFSMANAIAGSQRKLDLASLKTMDALAKAKFDYIAEITETLTPKPLDPITIGQNPPIVVTGVDVQSFPSPPIKLTLLQAGLLPQFYQFTESIIEVKMSLSSKSETTSETESGFDFSATAEASGGFLFGSASMSSTFSSHVNYKTSSTYSYTAEGSSLLRTTLKPVPPPPRFMPRFITVNALVTPPTVSVSA
jgi:hypothetical protein